MGWGPGSVRDGTAIRSRSMAWTDVSRGKQSAGKIAQSD